MSWGMVAVAGATVIGGAMASSAAGDAAEGQQQSAQQANALQLAMYNENNRLAAPALNTGNAARDRLSFLLGLSGTGFSNSSAPGVGGAGSGSTLGNSTNPNAPLNYDQLRQQLVGQYTKTNTSGTAPTGNYAGYNDAGLPGYFSTLYGKGGAVLGREFSGNNGYDESGNDWLSKQVGGQNGNLSTIDEQGLDAAIRQRLQQQQDEAAAREAAARADPNFGRLAQGFEFNTYTPDKFSYTGQDLYDDPSYKFRLEQGQKALDRQGAAGGRFLSGGQLQATSNYNQSAASQEFQAAYQRAAGTFNTNEGNRFGAFQANEGNRYNAYQTNFTNTVNPLLALSGAGQLATTQLMGNNSQYASTVGANLMGAANASGAAGIAGANAINGAIGGVANQYQTSQLLNRFGGSLNSNPGNTGAAKAYPPGYFSGAYAGDAG